MAAQIAHQGEAAATEWAEGLWNNRARDPQGGDTDQLRGLVSGECDIAISNTYYFARALRTDVDGLPDEALENIGWVFPAQDAEGAHMNLSGGGVAASAPNRDNAVRFLEYLASDQAQEYFSAGNDEYPAVPGVALSESVAQLGLFKPDDLEASAIADNIATAQMIANEVGWE
jgi:iron(III) transport system substrate-binding protein